MYITAGSWEIILIYPRIMRHQQDALLPRPVRTFCQIWLILRSTWRSLRAFPIDYDLPPIPRVGTFSLHRHSATPCIQGGGTNPSCFEKNLRSRLDQPHDGSICTVFLLFLKFIWPIAPVSPVSCASRFRSICRSSHAVHQNDLWTTISG